MIVPWRSKGLTPSGKALKWIETSRCTSLSTAATGAIERVGDRDYFRIEQDGILHFASVAMLDLRAYLLHEDGQKYATLDRNESRDVRAGDFLRIEAIGPYAGPSAQSAYFLQIE